MPAAFSRSPHLTKATKAFVDAITAENNPPLYTLPPQAARRILACLSLPALTLPGTT